MIPMVQPMALIRRHVTIEFDLLVSDVEAIREIAHPAMRTYVDAFIAAHGSFHSLDADNGQPFAVVGPDELHTVVTAMARSALAAGVDAIFPPDGTEIANVVVEDVAVG